jgi:hypothetical protein
LAGPKNFGAKVENPKNFPVEILKSEKSSGKIKKILKKCVLTGRLPEKEPHRNAGNSQLSSPGAKKSKIFPGKSPSDPCDGCEDPNSLKNSPLSGPGIPSPVPIRGVIQNGSLIPDLRVKCPVFQKGHF